MISTWINFYFSLELSAVVADAVGCPSNSPGVSSFVTESLFCSRNRVPSSRGWIMISLGHSWNFYLHWLVMDTGGAHVTQFWPKRHLGKAAGAFGKNSHPLIREAHVVNVPWPLFLLTLWFKKKKNWDINMCTVMCTHLNELLHIYPHNYYSDQNIKYFQHPRRLPHALSHQWLLLEVTIILPCITID